MQFLTAVTAALAASQTISASTAVPTTTCATPTATTTQVTQYLRCGRMVCTRPTRPCSAGEPTGPNPRLPYVYNTVTPAPGDCTAVAEAVYNPGCDLCPTCLAAAVAEPTVAAAVATPTMTVSVSI